METAKSPYRAVTRQIEVKVIPRFLPERSSPENGYYFWAYTITLTNLGGETVQLKTRHWRITDGQGRLQEVRGGPGCQRHLTRTDLTDCRGEASKSLPHPRSTRSSPARPSFTLTTC